MVLPTLMINQGDQSIRRTRYLCCMASWSESSRKTRCWTW